MDGLRDSLLMKPMGLSGDRTRLPGYEIAFITTLKMASDAGQPWFGGSFRRLSSARIRADWESAARGQPLLQPRIGRDVLITQLYPWPRDRLLVLVYDVDLEASE